MFKYIIIYIIFVVLVEGFSLNSIKSSIRAHRSPVQMNKRALDNFISGIPTKAPLKIISGINNYNIDQAIQLTNAAIYGGASHIDIACDVNLIKAVKETIGNTNDFYCIVSSIEPKKFSEAVAAGADMIEIGNYDSFYGKGMTFSAKDVIELTRQTKEILPDIPLSVTIPHTLSLNDQILLAKELETMKVDVIQTEGKFKSTSMAMGVQELIEIAAPTIASAYALSRAVNIPIMAASGLTDVSVPLALTAGAKAIGVGSAISKLNNFQEMVMAVSFISQAMGRKTNEGDVYQQIQNLELMKVQKSNKLIVD